MNLKLFSQTYKVLNTKEKLTIADSFVLRQNKIGHGNGEAKLYIGNNNSEVRNFLGNLSTNKLSCFLLKKDLIKYLEETKTEYLNPEQDYINKANLPKYWEERKAKIENLPAKIEFQVEEQTQIQGPRVYVNSKDKNYKLIRELSLPNITYIAIIKLSNEHNQIEYYFRLFTDFFGKLQHPYLTNQEKAKIEQIESPKERLVLTKARIGQGKYRKSLLKTCPFCPITLISNDRLLIASHIKPWSKSNNKEKIDPYNGFMFTPTYDFLFDRGYISFTNDKKIILSPFLSQETYKKLGLKHYQKFKELPIKGREKYLAYHRKEILLSLNA